MCANDLVNLLFVLVSPLVSFTADNASLTDNSHSILSALVYSAEWRSQSNPDIPRDRRSGEFRYRSRWVRTRQRCALVHEEDEVAWARDGTAVVEVEDRWEGFD